MVKCFTGCCKGMEEVVANDQGLWIFGVVILQEKILQIWNFTKFDEGFLGDYARQIQSCEQARCFAQRVESGKRNRLIFEVPWIEMAKLRGYKTKKISFLHTCTSKRKTSQIRQQTHSPESDRDGKNSHQRKFCVIGVKENPYAFGVGIKMFEFFVRYWTFDGSILRYEKVIE